MTKIEALKAFFEADDGQKVTVQELKALTEEERHELAALAAERDERR